MRKKDIEEVEKIITINNFLNENEAEVSVNLIVKKNMPLIAAQIDIIEMHREKQISSNSSVREHYANSHEIFAKLHVLMNEVHLFAETVSNEIGEDITERFEMPEGGSKRKYIVTARVFADQAAAPTLEPVFIKAGMEDNFIAKLRSGADMLEAALSSAISAKLERVGATGSLPVAIRESNRLIKLITPSIQKIFKDKPDKIAAWESAAHRKRDPKVKKKNNKNEPDKPQ